MGAQARVSATSASSRRAPWRADGRGKCRVGMGVRT
ncbi:Uncharacterised protein [Bordetella pertussis]|nr:Uncharacterised protein [Bordetella pertussis]